MQRAKRHVAHSFHIYMYIHAFVDDIRVLYFYHLVVAATRVHAHTHVRICIHVTFFSLFSQSIVDHVLFILSIVYDRILSFHSTDYDRILSFHSMNSLLIACFFTLFISYYRVPSFYIFDSLWARLQFFFLIECSALIMESLLSMLFIVYGLDYVFFLIAGSVLII